MKKGCLAALLLLSFALFPVLASAEVFTGDVHTTVTVSGTYFWSGIEVKDGQALEYTVKVESGDNVNVGLMDDSMLTLFLLGTEVTTVHNDKDTTSSSYTYTTAGKYALVIDNGLGSSECKVDLVVRSASFWETGTGCIVIVLIVVIIGVVVLALVGMWLRKRRPAAQPQQQFVAPVSQYGAPAYPAQQYPAQAPPQYPAAQQYPAQPPPQYPAAPQGTYEAPAPAGYATQPATGHSAPPTPTQPGAPAAPAAPGATMQCKYCDFQMPAGTQICPRCGGFN